MTARDRALFLIDQADLPGWKPGLLARRGLRDVEPTDPRDRALAENIAVGTVRHLLILKRLITHHSGRKLVEIDPAVQKILAAGLFQLRYLTRVPASAVVNEAVGQCARHRLGRAGGFVNAVLRNATRRPDPPPPDESDTRGQLEQVAAVPFGLYRRLLTRMTADDAIRLCRRLNDPPPTILRLRDELSPERLELPGVTLLPHQRPGHAVIENAGRELLARLADAGLAQVQDPTSAAVVGRLALRPGLSVLDRCAGVGTKTLQIIDAVGAGHGVFAVEPARHRLETLARSLERRGIEGVRLLETHQLADVPELPTTFDRILIDAPCSNSGVLRRRAEARFRQTEKDLASLERLQKSILADTLPRLAVGGRLVWSTCSIWESENEAIARWVCGRDPSLRLIEQSLTLPSSCSEPAAYHDGGYVAVFERVG